MCAHMEDRKMDLLAQLMQYSCIKSQDPGLSPGEVLARFEGGIDPRLKEGISRGIDPLKGHGRGRIDRRFLAALSLARNADEKIRVHNACVALGKGKPCDYVTPFQSDANLYVFRRVKEWHDMAHREAEMPASNAIAGLQAGRDLKSEFMHVMQDSLRSGEKWA